MRYLNSQTILWSYTKKSFKTFIEDVYNNFSVFFEALRNKSFGD